MKDNLENVSNEDERETHINIVHSDKTIFVYTTNATVMNRMTRKEIPHKSDILVDGKVFGREYEIPWAKFGSVATAGLFKCL